MKKVRMGMVGGGQGAFIGAVHRIAAAMDGEIELVCGAFSADPKTSVASGQELGLPLARCYPSYQEMFAGEAELPEDQGMDFVAVVTPNHLHYQISKMAMEFGFHVLCDKPATFDFPQALALSEVIKNSGCLYALTHAYNGYPMIKEAKQRVASGELGNIIKVVVEYHQGWLAPEEDFSNKQARWRLNPDFSGASGCMGDIGVHAANLTEYVTGLEITKLYADLNKVVPGRKLDDDGVVLIEFDNHAKGVLLASQVCVGEENNLRLRVYGDKKSLEWCQLEPNTLWLKSNSEATQMLRSGVGQLSQQTRASLRTPAGHPEGYLEAFANIYLSFARQIRAKQLGRACTNTDFDVPGIYQALRGMAFIQQAVKSSHQQAWLPLHINNNSEGIAHESD